MSSEESTSSLDNLIKITRVAPVSPFENEEQMLKRERLHCEERADEFTDALSIGLTSFLIDDESGKAVADFEGIMNGFQNLPEIKANDTLEKVGQALIEQNLFSLKEADFEHYLGLADKRYSQEDLDRAGPMYQTLTLLFPKNLEPWLRWGAVAFQKKDIDKALEIYNQCAEIFSHPAAYLGASACQVEKKNFSEAVSLLKECALKCEESHEDKLLEDCKALLAALA